MVDVMDVMDAMAIMAKDMARNTVVTATSMAAMALILKTIKKIQINDKKPILCPPIAGAGATDDRCDSCSPSTYLNSNEPWPGI
jgi:hypothetical protein